MPKYIHGYIKLTFDRKQNTFFLVNAQNKFYHYPEFKHINFSKKKNSNT